MWKLSAVLGALSLFLGWLLLEAKEDLGEEREACNSSKLAAVAEAERAARQAVTESYEARMEQMARQFDIEVEARKIAEAARLQSEAGVEVRDLRIKQLELEVFNAEELPDSRACLNVFVPGDSVERVFWDEDCAEAGDSGDSEDGVCADPAGSSRSDAPDFAAITFGDASTGWSHDRKSLRQCIGQLRAIGVLNESYRN